MSAISSGSVSIAFVPDTSAIDAYLAGLRSSRIIVGVGVSPSVPGDAKTGPATFGNAGGVPTFPGYGSFGGIGTSNLAFSGTSPQISGIQQGAQQLTQAATQLTQVIGQLMQVVGRAGTLGAGGGEPLSPPPSLDPLVDHVHDLRVRASHMGVPGDAAAIAGPGGRQSGSGRGGFWRGGRLARYATAGFGATEAINLIQGDIAYRRQYEQTPGGGIDRPLAAAQRYAALQDTPIAGPVGAAIHGFLTGDRTQAVDIFNIGQDIDVLGGQTNARYADFVAHRQIAGSARVAGSVGFERQRQEIAVHAEVQRQETTHRQSERLTGADTERRRRIERAHDELMRVAKPLGTLGEITQSNSPEARAATKRYNDAVSGANADFEASRQAIVREFGADFSNTSEAARLLTAATNRDEAAERIGRSMGAWAGVLHASGNPFGARVVDIGATWRAENLRNPSMLNANTAVAVGGLAASAIEAGWHFTAEYGSTGRIAGESRALLAQMRHDPLGAFHEHNEADRAAAIRQASMLPVLGPFNLRGRAIGAVNSLFDTMEQANTQHFGEETERQRFGIAGRTESYNIAAGRSSRYPGASLAQLPALASLNDFVSNNRASQRDAILGGRPELAGSIAGEGRAGIGAMRADFLRSFHGQEVSPGRTIMSGPGTTNASIMMRAFSDANTDVGTPAPNGGGGGGSGGSSDVAAIGHAILDWLRRAFPNPGG